MKTKMQRTKDRMIDRIREHGENLKRIYPGIDLLPVTLCKKLRRLEAKAHTLAEECCDWRSVDDTRTTMVEWGILKKVKGILGPVGPEIFLNYDPRGYALKICSEDAQNLKIYKDWGGYGIIAPDFTEG